MSHIPTLAYRVVTTLHYTPAQLALAPRYSAIADAFNDMGEGCIIAPDGHMVAFHERHMRFIEANPALIEACA